MWSQICFSNLLCVCVKILPLIIGLFIIFYSSILSLFWKQTALIAPIQYFVFSFLKVLVYLQRGVILPVHFHKHLLIRFHKTQGRQEQLLLTMLQLEQWLTKGLRSHVSVNVHSLFKAQRPGSWHRITSRRGIQPCSSLPVCSSHLTREITPAQKYLKRILISHFIWIRICASFDGLEVTCQTLIATRGS